MTNESPEQLETRLSGSWWSVHDIESKIQEDLDDIKDLIEEVNEPQPYAWSFKVC